MPKDESPTCAASELSDSTAVGLQPMNFILTEAGQTLAHMHSYRDLYSMRNMLTLLGCALLALVPVTYASCTSVRDVTKAQVTTAQNRRKRTRIAGAL